MTPVAFNSFVRSALWMMGRWSDAACSVIDEFTENSRKKPGRRGQSCNDRWIKIE
jgi:hypothetical protein